MNMRQKIKLKFRAFDHRVLDRSVTDIVGAVERAGAVVRGPVPLPKKIERFTVNRSTHVNKKAREQFEMRHHSRLLFIVDPSPQTIDALMKLDLPSGIDVEIKIDEVS